MLVFRKTNPSLIEQAYDGTKFVAIYFNYRNKTKPGFIRLLLKLEMGLWFISRKIRDKGKTLSLIAAKMEHLLRTTTS